MFGIGRTGDAGLGLRETFGLMFGDQTKKSRVKPEPFSLVFLLWS